MVFGHRTQRLGGAWSIALVITAGCYDSVTDPSVDTEGTTTASSDATAGSVTPPTTVDETSAESGSCVEGEPGCPCGPSGECDPGLSCDGDTCLPPEPVCGDGVTQGDEQCDAGPELDDQGDCKTDCTSASCGDGFLGPGEQCDDGNLIDHDGCSNACQPASCGDGLLQDGEACDDGNVNDTDACLSVCIAASCGDGIVWRGEEACDDGNGSNTDACVGSCANASCGDGFLWSGRESCDGSALGGATCVSQGFVSGTLACSGDCTYNTSGCASA